MARRVIAADREVDAALAPRRVERSARGGGKDRKDQVAEVWARPLGDGEDLLVGGGLAAAVGDHRDPGDPQPVSTGGDHFGTVDMPTASAPHERNVATSALVS